jgi:orotidine 5'-phosphate decarboxylase subfamily 1
MDEKQTNLCVAADVTTKQELLRLADLLGQEICLFKTHIDIVEDFDNDLIIQLQRLSKKHNFLIFEDRKFADIGKTVQLQYEKGVYHIADWAHITNAHTVAGPGSIEALKAIGLPKGRGLLVLAEMTPKGTLAKDSYTDASIEMAKQYRDFVIGFITTRQLADDPTFINMTPGVQLAQGTDAFGQQFFTPETVIGKNKSDVIIVGRGIIEAADPLREARAYRASGWSAYRNRAG